MMQCAGPILQRADLEGTLGLMPLNLYMKENNHVLIVKSVVRTGWHSSFVMSVFK